MRRPAPCRGGPEIEIDSHDHHEPEARQGFDSVEPPSLIRKLLPEFLDRIAGRNYSPHLSALQFADDPSEVTDFHNLSPSIHDSIHLSNLLF